MRAITEEIEKIRNVRKKISASFGHDPKKLVAYYEKLASAESTPPKRTPRRTEQSDKK
jgi:hypothetical protein